MMLFDDEEIEIMSKAAQPHLRDPRRSELISKRIFDNFFDARKLTGSRVLELGPGQYDFARMIEAAGATVVSMDHDPAVIALGQKRGYNIIFSNFRRFDWSSVRGEFDGLFCRGAINAFWYRDPKSLGGFIDDICSVLKPSGWGWLAPFNHVIPSDATQAHIKMMLDAQRQAFERHGFSSFIFSSEIAALYAVGERQSVFLRNVKYRTVSNYCHPFRKFLLADISN